MKRKLLKSVFLLIGICTISFSANSVCAPGSYFLANGGHLVPYYESHEQVGEKCILGAGDCSCIGMIYWY